MNPTHSIVDQIFSDALRHPEGPERTSYLDEACGGNVELRERVARLLKAYNDASSFLESPVIAAPTTVTIDPPVAEGAGTTIGPYKLVEPIGEGGMGAVWMAHQTEPVKRLVAIKLIRAGMGSAQFVARFEAERQALALMDHPNIARVLDAGTTTSGRPYFVMDLVKGVPITKYCDEHHLTPRERLELFIPVCQAVQHAHQKGIIHRDLKPSNVLVAPYDDRPVPKVIDFGVAKATGQRLTDATMFTGFGAVIGTPEYMSPEQAETNNQDIDTRSDIYALGVLLYELLAGSPPFSHKDLEKAGMLEMLRVIREQEPSKPSTKVSTAEGLPTLAANRGTEPTKLTNLLRGDLDWIVMKALDKDRTRRYETANGFARDIQRYLTDEPVEACPPSAGYRLRKFAQRNRGPVIAASLVLLSLVAGVIGTTVGMFEATRAADAEREAKNDALHQKHLANQAAEKERQATVREAQRADGEQKAKLEAERNLAFARKGNQILGSVFAELNPSQIAESGRPLQDVLRENLGKAVKELEGSAIGDPLEVAAMQNTLGLSLRGLGEYEQAAEVLKKSLQTRRAKLSPDHPDTLSNMNNLALAYRDAGKLGLALPLFEEALKLRKAKLGPEHPLTLNSMNSLAEAYRDAGKLDLALPLFEETLKLRKAKLGSEHPDTFITMNNLALAYKDAGKLDLALPLYEETLKLRRAKLGFEHPLTLGSMNNLAVAYKDAGKLDLALPLYEETLKLRKAKLGFEHPETLTSMNNLAMAYQDAGKLDLALPLIEETLKLTKAKLGPEHPHTLSSMNNLAMAYQDAGKLDLALPLFEETLKLTKAKLGPEHPRTLMSMNNLAEAYRTAGKLDLALPLIVETLKLTKAKLGPEHPHTLSSMNNLALAYQDAGKLDLALPLFEETLKISKAKLGPGHPDTLNTMNNLARAYDEIEHFNKAEVLYRERLPLLKQIWSGDSPAYAAALAALGLNLLHQRKWTDAEPLLRDCQAIREKTQPDAWTTFSTKSLLGWALLGQKKYADAEPLMLKAYEGMKQREKSIPSPGLIRLPEALDRLIELYTATNKPDEIKKWQAERAKYPAAKK